MIMLDQEHQGEYDHPFEASCQACRLHTVSKRQSYQSMSLDSYLYQETRDWDECFKTWNLDEPLYPKIYVRGQ